MMGLVTMTMATAISSGSVSGLPPVTAPIYPRSVWSLPSDALPASRLLIHVTVATYSAGPQLEGAMRAAVLSSTEHRYDL
jgi:hypothetical protein